MENQKLTVNRALLSEFEGALTSYRDLTAATPRVLPVIEKQMKDFCAVVQKNIGVIRHQPVYEHE